jgi:hypothetical protein
MTMTYFEYEGPKQMRQPVGQFPYYVCILGTNIHGEKGLRGVECSGVGDTEQEAFDSAYGKIARKEIG